MYVLQELEWRITSVILCGSKHPHSAPVLEGHTIYELVLILLALWGLLLAFRDTNLLEVYVPLRASQKNEMQILSR